MHKAGRLPIAFACAMACSQAVASSGFPVGTPVTLQDLAEMRSIDSLTISRDGTLAAFRVITPSLERNSVAVQWFWVDILSPNKSAVPLGHLSLPLRQPMFDTILDGQAQWAEDGKSLFVQTLRGDRVTVNRIAPDGIDRLAAEDAADIETFRILPGGRQIEIGVRASRQDIDQAAEKEHRAGIHIDRTVSLEGSRLTSNFQIGSRWSTMRYAGKGNLAREAFSGDLRQKLVPISGTSRKVATRMSPSGKPIDTPLSGSGPDAADRRISIEPGGMTAHLVQAAPPNPFLGEPTFQLVVQMPDGSERRCKESFCFTHSRALKGVSWNAGERELVIAYEPDYSARITLHGWKPETDTSRVIRAADGALDGGAMAGSTPCPTNGRYLVCVHAGPASPPELVRVDMTTGVTTRLFDPNPVLRRRQYNPVRFMEWKDADGNTFTGLLATPFQQSGPVPLVITSYFCRGFLRGGFTSLAPEQLLAQRGIAALCVNHNYSVGMTTTPDGKLHTLAPHLGALAGYEAIIRQLASQNIVDASRVGLAGHSFTSMVGAYALSHTDLFKSVVIGTGITIDPATMMFIDPVRHGWNTSLLDVLNVPHPLDDTEGRWSAISPALNARKVKGSLLIQTPENEYLSAVQLFSSIQHAGGASDMYIYPNEGHLVTREPAHQFSRMKRSVDWFDFWLNGRESSDPGDAGQNTHWRTLKAEMP